MANAKKPDHDHPHGGHVDFDHLERDWYEIEYKVNALAGVINDLIFFGGTLPGFGGVSPNTVGGSTNAGTSTSVPHADHDHGGPGFGGVSNLVYGGSSNAGASTSLSNAAHVHGLGLPTIEIESGGTTKGAYDHLNFAGAGVVVTTGGTTATITVSSTAVSPINVESNGTTLGSFDTLNFTGATVTASGTTANIAVSGAANAVRIDSTAGNFTINSTVWANVSTALDISLAGNTSDWVEIGVSGLWNSDAVFSFMDVVSVVNTSVVNSFADQAAPNNAHEGLQSWYGPSGVLSPISGSILKKLTSAELTTAGVMLRLRARTNTATNKTLFAQANNPLSVWARNLGA